LCLEGIFAFYRKKPGDLPQLSGNFESIAHGRNIAI
jgi:hypothetical protein